MIKDSLKENIDGCAWFKWHEALWLPRWNIYAVPKNDEIIKNIISTAKIMDKIRIMFGQPIIVTSWYRPEQYNELIGGAKKSSHLTGMACDFIISKHESNNVREILRKYLQNLNVRMERLDTPHVHIDINCDRQMSNDARYFKP
jgi:hypothetical protein